MSAIDLFGQVPSDRPVGPKCGPQGGKHYTQPRGYAGMPGTGPEGKFCRDCAHYVRRQGGSRCHPKCLLMKPRWTAGRGSDILARSPACSRFHEDTTP